MLRALLEKLRPNGVFVITGGMLAYSPWPKAAKVAEAYLDAVEGTHNGAAVFVDGYQPAEKVV